MLQEDADHSPGKYILENNAQVEQVENNKSVVIAKGRWTREEHFRFLQALKTHGKEWKYVQKHVATRSSTQARSHAQKFFSKLDKKGLTLDQFLDQIDLDNLRSMIENDSDYGDEDDQVSHSIASTNKAPTNCKVQQKQTLSQNNAVKSNFMQNGADEVENAHEFATTDRPNIKQAKNVVPLI